MSMVMLLTESLANYFRTIGDGIEIVRVLHGARNIHQNGSHRVISLFKIINMMHQADAISVAINDYSSN